ncbi:MAG: hypothetical protein MRZ79_03915 [Bacteroidia bacterium]|nr:hypothetical protein [Bacteroidia bacterium]
MKLYTQIYVLVTILLAFSLVACENQNDSSSNKGEKTNEMAEKDGASLIDGSKVRISQDDAVKSVDTYIGFFASENGIPSLSNQGSCDSECSNLAQTVTLPKYFVVDSAKFNDLLKSVSDGASIYASFGIKLRTNGVVETPTPVVSLLFHKNRPNPDGTIPSDQDEEFLDYSNTCPIDCNEHGVHKDGGFDGGPVSKDDAKARIECYNCVYGSDPNTKKYITITNTPERILLPRYFKFSENDIDELLSAMSTRAHKFFYVSLGANLDPATMPDDHTYLSDLVFHYTRPDLEGNLSNPETDEFFDITEPCPNACGT